MTLTEHARSTLRGQIARLDAQMGLALARCGEDEVHDFRVAVRRIGQALRVFAHLFPDREARSLRRALKPALDAAAHVRDLDVDSALLRRLGMRAAHPLLERMKADRERGALALRGHLYLLRSEEIPTVWLDRLELLRETGEDASQAARGLLPPLAEEFFKAGRKAAARAGAAAQLHAFRLAAKRFRYTLEIFRCFYGPVFERRLGQVRGIQGLLGERQDCAVTAALLEPAASFDPEAADCLRAVHRRAVKLESEFAHHWPSSVDAPGQELLWVRYLRRRQTARHAS